MSYEIIDTHAHLYHADYDQDWEAMLERAWKAGVGRIIMPSIDSSTFEGMHRLSRLYPHRLLMAIGLHPSDVNESFEQELNFIEKKLQEYSFIALGECGLDYYWDTTYKAQQWQAFAHQIKLANAYKLPLIIHTRSAFEDTCACLEQFASPELRGVFHCFTGTEEEMEQALEFESFMIALGGVVTFKNSQLRDYVGRIPLDRLVVETDAPFLSPAPLRGKRNEPAHLVHVLEYLAPLYGLNKDELISITTNNAKRLFSLPD